MEGIRPDEEPVLKTGGGVSRLGVRVPRLPLRNMRPWCNWQHDWFQPSWSGFESLGACLEDGSENANLSHSVGLIVQQEDAGVACRKSRCKSEWVHCNVQMVLWPSGEGSSVTRRRSVVRVHPGLLAPKWSQPSVHDVTAAYLLPMQIVWVRFPLHALWPSCAGPGL